MSVLDENYIDIADAAVEEAKQKATDILNNHIATKYGVHELHSPVRIAVRFSRYNMDEIKPAKKVILFDKDTAELWIASDWLPSGSDVLETASGDKSLHWVKYTYSVKK